METQIGSRLFIIWFSYLVLLGK